MRRPNHLVLLIPLMCGSPAAGAEEPPPATQPSAIDKLLDDLARIEPKLLVDRLAALQQQQKQLTEEVAALKARAAQLDADLARINRQIELLDVLVKARSMAPASQPAVAASQPAPAAPPAMAMAARPPMPEGDKPAGPPPVNFADHVLPIINEKCAGCHNPDRARGGLILVNFNDLMQGGSSGKVVEPGSPDASRLYKLVAHQEEPYMPPKQDKLEEAKIEVIRKWIEAGALPDAKAKPMAAKPKPTAKPAVAGAVEMDGPMPADLPAVAPASPLHPPPAVALAASPNADLLAVGGDAQIYFYQAGARKLLGALDFPEGRIEKLAFSGDGTWLLAAGGHTGKSGTAVVFDVETGARKGTFDQHYDAVLAAGVSPDTGLVAVGGTNSKVRVFDAYGKTKAYELTAHNDWIEAIEFSPDGTLLATADRAGGMFVWEADTGREIHNLRGHNGGVSDLSFRADSQRLVSTGEDGTVRLWEMDEGRQTRQWQAHSGVCLSVEFAPDGRLATCGADGQIRLWDQEGKHLRDMPRQDDWVYSVDFSADAKSVVVGTYKGSVAFFETETGKELGTISTAPGGS